MKNNVLILALLAVTVFSSCKKDNVTSCPTPEAACRILQVADSFGNVSLRYTYNAKGQNISIADRQHTVTITNYFYNASGLVDSLVQIDSASNKVFYTSAFSYNASCQISSSRNYAAYYNTPMAYVGESKYIYSANLLTSVDNYNPSLQLNNTTYYTYDTLGNRLGIRYSSSSFSETIRIDNQNAFDLGAASQLLNHGIAHNPVFRHVNPNQASDDEYISYTYNAQGYPEKSVTVTGTGSNATRDVLFYTYQCQ